MIERRRQKCSLNRQIHKLKKDLNDKMHIRNPFRILQFDQLAVADPDLKP